MGMEEITKKINKFMTISMGITISLILSTYGVLSNGHFSVITLILSMIVSVTLAMIIGFTIPLRKFIDYLTRNITGVLEAIIDNFIMNTVYVLIICTCNIFLMTSMANKNIDKIIVTLSNKVTEYEELEKKAETDPAIVISDKEKNDIENIKNEITKLQISKPNFKRIYPRQLLMSFIISFFLSFVFRKIFLGYALKKNGITI